ncbi:hypothetical protein ACFL13_01500 [Patescibacteria group bacterium]
MTRKPKPSGKGSKYKKNEEVTFYHEGEKKCGVICQVIKKTVYKIKCRGKFLTIREGEITT